MNIGTLGNQAYYLRLCNFGFSLRTVEGGKVAPLSIRKVP